MNGRQATNWPNGVQQPPSPTGSYEERLRSSYELRFEALKIDVEHSTQLQLDQMRSEFSSQLALQQAQFQQQQQDFLRQVHAQQSQLIAMVNPQRPRLSLSTDGSYNDPIERPGSADSFEAHSSAAFQTPASGSSLDGSPRAAPLNPFQTFSSIHSFAGTELLSPTRISSSSSSLLGPQRPSTSSTDFLRSWTLDLHYAYTETSSGDAGFMCRRCPQQDEWDSSTKRRFGFYKCSKEKPASITKRAKEHSLRHFEKDAGGGEGKGHRRRRSEGDTRRPYIVERPSNIEDDAASTGSNAVSSREASPSRDYRPQHARSSSAPHYDLPTPPGMQTNFTGMPPPSPVITCSEYEGDLLFHPAAVQMDHTSSEDTLRDQDSDQRFLEDFLLTPPNDNNQMDTGSTSPPPISDSFSFPSSLALEFVNPSDVYLQRQHQQGSFAAFS